MKDSAKGKDVSDSSVRKLKTSLPDLNAAAIISATKAEAREIKLKNNPSFEARLLLRKISKPEHLRSMYEDGHESKDPKEATIKR